MMIRRAVLALTALALAAPAFAQTGYGAPSSGEYRDEQQRTAALNTNGDDGYGGDGYVRPDEPGYARDRADYDRRLGDNARDRADYRNRLADHRADLRAWRDRVRACNAGVHSACAGYQQRYGSYGDGRYYAPPAERYGSDDDRYALPRPVYRGAGRYDDARDAYPDDRDDEPADDGDGGDYPG